MRTNAGADARLADLLKRLDLAVARVEGALIGAAPVPSNRDDLRRAQAEIGTLKALNEALATRVQAAIDRARAALDE
jgi:hypothetical protein